MTGPSRKLFRVRDNLTPYAGWQIELLEDGDAMRIRVSPPLSQRQLDLGWEPADFASLEISSTPEEGHAYSLVNLGPDTRDDEVRLLWRAGRRVLGIERSGLDPRRPGPKPGSSFIHPDLKGVLLKVIEELGDKATIERIAERAGVSESTVKRWTPPGQRSPRKT